MQEAANEFQDEVSKGGKSELPEGKQENKKEN